MTYDYKEYVEVPSAALNISDTLAHDVSGYAVAKVEDTNLNASNIKMNTSVLGIKGELDYTKEVTSVPTLKETSVIHNSTDDEFYIWVD